MGKGDGHENHLPCYNVSTNDWVYPRVSGNTPSFTRHNPIVIRDDTLFLFGGGIRTSHGVEALNYLHILNMKTMSWKLVHGPSSEMASNRVVPSARRLHSLTLISQNVAVLYGGIRETSMGGIKETSMGGIKSMDVGGNAIGDCWLLNLDRARQLQDPSSIWTEVTRPDLSPRLFHSAVMDLVIQRLWLIGGMKNFDKDVMEAPKKITLSAVPLKVLAAEYAAKSICKDDPKLQPGQCPEILRKDIHAVRSLLCNQRCQTLIRSGESGTGSANARTGSDSGLDRSVCLSRFAIVPLIFRCKERTPCASDPQILIHV